MTPSRDYRSLKEQRLLSVTKERISGMEGILILPR